MFYQKNDKFAEEFVTLVQLQNIVFRFNRLIEEKKKGKISEAKYKKQFCRMVKRIHKPAVILRGQNVFMANRYIEKIFMIPPKKMTGRNFLNYIHSEELSKVTEDCRSRMNGEDKPGSIYPTVVLNKDLRAVPVILQIANINYFEEPAILGILEKKHKNI